MTDTFRKNYSEDETLKIIADELKSLAENLEYHFDTIVNSREKSIALTKLEECVMWGVKAIYNGAD